MNHKERMSAALARQPVDKIPHGEVMLHDVLIEKILKETIPGAADNALIRWMTEELSESQFDYHKKAREFLAFDFIHTFAREPWVNIGETKENYPVLKDPWGLEMVSTPLTLDIEKKPIETPQEMATYQFPSIGEFKFDNLRRWVNNSEFFVVCQLDTGFFKINQLIGFDNYMYYLYEYRDLLRELSARFYDFELALARKAIAEGADCIWFANDFAYNSGPFISPKDLWEMDFSFMKPVVAEIHDLGKPVVMHACGNMNFTLDLLVEVGLDGLHSLQPSAGNDIAAIKELYRDRLCLLGNMDISRLLPFGSPYEVDQAIKNLVLKVGKQGGLVITTCNLLDLDIPVENAITMHLAIEKYSHFV